MGSERCDALQPLRRAALVVPPWRVPFALVALHTQQISVDGRDLFDDLPPALIIGDPTANGGQDRGGQRNLLGSAPREADGKHGGGVPLARCAPAVRLTTANRTFENAAAQDFLDGRQLLDDALTLGEQPLGFHISAL